MPQIDLTITISVIVALAAIVSPIATALINNRYQLKLKRIDLDQIHLENTVLYKRNIFENYLKCVGRCINISDIDALKDYGEYYFLALTYAPEHIREALIKIDHAVADSDYVTATALLEEITPRIREMLQTL